MIKEQLFAHPLWITGELDNKWTEEFINYVKECKANKKDALAFISGDAGGNPENVLTISRILKVIGVKLTTIGYGNINPVATALFCQGNERILIPGSQIAFAPLGNGYEKLYMLETGINQTIFELKMLETSTWLMKSDLWEMYRIITSEYTEFLDAISNFSCDADTQKPYFFMGELNAKSTKDILEYIYACVACDTEAILVLNLTGGDVKCLVTIISTIELLKGSLTTSSGERVASDDVESFLNSNATLVVHWDVLN